MKIYINGKKNDFLSNEANEVEEFRKSYIAHFKNDEEHEGIKIKVDDVKIPFIKMNNKGNFETYFKTGHELEIEEKDAQIQDLKTKLSESDYKSMVKLVSMNELKYYRNIELQKEIDELKCDFGVLDNDFNEQIDELEELADVISDLKNDNYNKDDKIRSLHNVYDDLQLEFKGMCEKYGELYDKNNKLENKIVELEGQLYKKDKKMVHACDEILSLNGKIRRLENGTKTINYVKELGKELAEFYRKSQDYDTNLKGDK